MGGICVDEKGTQRYLDSSLAYKRAVLNCIKYLANFGFTEEQVYLLLSCCPCEGRISGIVDVPNAVATLAVTRNTTPSRESNPRKPPAPYDPKLALCMPC